MTTLITAAKETNHNSKQIQVANAERGKTCVSESWLIFVYFWLDEMESSASSKTLLVAKKKWTSVDRLKEKSLNNDIIEIERFPFQQKFQFESPEFPLVN